MRRDVNLNINKKYKRSINLIKLKEEKIKVKCC
jgi:hypothetical protein